MSDKTLHIISQDNQPIGSWNKSCDECGLFIGELDNYVDEHVYFTKEIADKYKLTRCTDQ